ncbi:MAG: transcriptional repressor [Verrucomicrobiota bacterium]
MERKTRQQEAISLVLKESDMPLTPQEVLLRAKKHVSNIGIATVYRGLKRLLELNLVALVEIPGTPPHYESTEKRHHHHFVCRSCEKIFDIDGCIDGVDNIAPKNFKVDSHEITLYGICVKCLPDS